MSADGKRRLIGPYIAHDRDVACQIMHYADERVSLEPCISALTCQLTSSSLVAESPPEDPN